MVLSVTTLPFDAKFIEVIGWTLMTDLWIAGSS